MKTEQIVKIESGSIIRWFVRQVIFFHPERIFCVHQCDRL